MKHLHKPALRTVLGLLAVTAGTAVPAQTQTTAAPASAANAASAAAAPAKVADSKGKQELICTTERVTGSRFSRRLCHTREELDAMKRAGVETVTKIQELPVPIKSE
jgi:hypothetical protein